MPYDRGLKFAVVLFAIAMFGALAQDQAQAQAQAQQDQQIQYPKPSALPDPYRLVQGWPSLPATMNGGHWGEVIRVSIDRSGNVWVFHRCFNVVPPGSAVCINRGEANPPILEFDPSGKLLKSFGAGLLPILMASPSTPTETCGRATSTTRRQYSACRQRTPTVL
jgi:hypothetical protein